MLGDVGHPDQTRAFAVLLGESVALESPSADWFRRRYERLIESLAEGIADARRAGTVRPEADPEAIASEALAVMDGLQLQYLLTGDEEAYFERLEATCAGSWSGWRAERVRFAWLRRHPVP